MKVLDDRTMAALWRKVAEDRITGATDFDEAVHDRSWRRALRAARWYENERAQYRRRERWEKCP